MKVSVLVFLVGLLALSGCSSVQTQQNPKADLQQFKKFYVEHRLTDDHHIDELIVAELRSYGLVADAGPLTMMPRDTDAVVSYVDTWAWDFKSYLYQLDIGIRDARRESGLATGSYRQPTMITKEPAEVIRLILRPIFKRQ